MKSAVTVMLVFATACVSDPTVNGDALWTAAPPGGPIHSSSSFTLAYAKRLSPDSWIVKTIGNDEVVSCSEAEHIGAAGMFAILSDASLAAPGDLAIADAPPDATHAQLTFDKALTAGTLTLTRVDERITATFTGTFSVSTVQGRFDAVRCD